MEAVSPTQMVGQPAVGAEEIRAARKVSSNGQCINPPLSLKPLALSLCDFLQGKYDTNHACNANGSFHDLLYPKRQKPSEIPAVYISPVIS